MSKKKWGLFLLLSPIGIVILYFIVSLIFWIIGIKIGVSASESWTIIYASKQFVNSIILILGIITVFAGIPIGAILISKNYDKKKFMMTDISRQSWIKAKKKFVTYLLIILTVVVVYSIFGLLFNLDTKSLIMNSINNVINLLIGTVFAIGFVEVSLRIADDKHVRYSYFYNKIRLKLFFQMLGARILYGLIAFAGFILLIIPGIIWITRFQFYRFFIVEKGMGPIKALRASRAITSGHVPELIAYYLLLFCINMLGMICLFVGLLRTVPMTMTAQAILYRKLAGNK